MSQDKHFGVCVRNSGYEGALELRKLYEVIEDPSAEEHNQVRVVDESGEDYLYSKSWFLPVELPRAVQERIAGLAAK
jgi:hypothetical protein